MHPRIVSLLAVCSFVLMSAAGVDAQITITAPTLGATSVGSAEDYATRTFQDPWDMDKRTDLGWFTWGEDQPLVNLSGRTLSNGVFSGVATSTDPNFWLLDTHTAGFGEFGKVGSKFKIDGNRYKILLLRMGLSSAPTDFTSGGPVQMQVLWSNNTFATLDEKAQPVPNGGARQSLGIVVPNAGMWIHAINLATLGALSGPQWPGTNGGLVDALRIDPTQYIESGRIDLDFARLTEDSVAFQRTITWTGGSADIFLTTNNTCSENQAQIANDNATGSLTFPVGSLPAGDYYVGMRSGSSTSTTLTCSSGFYRVGGVPTMAFTSPSEEGSSDDFATAQLGNAWDMDAFSDIEYSTYVLNPSITTINAEDEAGNSLGAVRVLKGTSPAPGNQGADDPYLYALYYGGRTAPWGLGLASGNDYRIDTNRYRILTFEMAVDNPTRQIAAGSHARIIWHVAGELNAQGFAAENVSTDVILNHIGGRLGTAASPQVMAKVIIDMKTPNINETDAGASPSTSGWVQGSSPRPGVDGFRIDPFEFPGGKDFFLRRLKLAAFERFASAYTIKWTFSSPTSDPFTISFFHDTDNQGFNGTAIAECTNLSPTAGSCNWTSTASVGNGEQRFIYSQIKSGSTVVNQAYARWPVVKDAAFTPSRPVMTLDRDRFNFAGSRNGQLLSEQQQLRLTITGTGASSVQWRATVIETNNTAHTQFVSVSPSTGTGNGVITVSIIPSSVIPDTLSGTWAVKVEEIAAGTTANSPQYARAYFQMYPLTSTLAPFGSFDTPAGGANIQGSIAVTGWAADDVGIDRVEIWRDLQAGETTVPFSSPGHPGNGKVFIASGIFVEGARPDVEAAYPSHPLAHRTGWGYLLLTWGLWDQGNGPFTLHAFAFDKDGHAVTLGTKAITTSNRTAVKPFGALDTPEYGLTKSGQFFNFGWGLTPNANSVDTRNCTITNGNVFVGIDSGPLVAVIYGDSRTDIAGFFPGFSNGSSGGGHFLIDTTTMTNGTHQIGWFIVDNCGRADGIGSRFFNVFNSSSLVGATAAPGEPASFRSSVRLQPDQDSVRLQPDQATATILSDQPPDAGDTVTARRNLGEWQAIDVASDGGRIVELSELERLELQLPGGGAPYAGGQVVNGAVRALPLGSSLDAQAGVFYWQPAAGFVGAYDLVFASGVALPADASSPPAQALRVRVVVGPPVRMAIDAPAAGALSSQPFLVAGWAIDLAAREGSGVDTVHVWAHPVAGGSAVFLGVATVGEARPDVAATYGDRFAGAAYNLVAKPPPPGVYDVVVYVHRAATDRFDAAQSVRVTMP